jgi:hypothetical protein
MLAENKWRSHGEKQQCYISYLLRFINNHWDDIFGYDTTMLRVKIHAIAYLHQQNSYMCNYEWVGRIKELILTSINDVHVKYNDVHATQLEKANTNLRTFENRFEVSFDQYNVICRRNKNTFINNTTNIENMALLRPIFLYMNRHYFTLFTFNKQIRSRGFNKNTYDRMNTFIDACERLLISNVGNESEQRHIKLSIKTFNNIKHKISLHVGTVIHCVLNRIFHTDITLYITDYL